MHKRKRYRPRKLWEAYDPPHDLHDALIESGIDFRIIAKVAGSSERILRYRLAGYYRLTDELLLLLIDFINFPDEFRPYPVLTSIKASLKRHDVGLRRIVKMTHQSYNALFLAIEGFRYIGGPTQEKYILSTIRKVYNSRSPVIREFVHLLRLKKRTKVQSERLTCLGKEFGNHGCKTNNPNYCS